MVRYQKNQSKVCNFFVPAITLSIGPTFWYALVKLKSKQKRNSKSNHNQTTHQNTAYESDKKRNEKDCCYERN